MADMDDFFGSLSSDINEQDAEAAEALKREKEAKRNAQANPIRPQDEVPKLEYFEWFHEESKATLQHNTGNSQKRIVQTELYRCQHLYYAKKYEECLDGYRKLVTICDGNLKKDAEDGVLHCLCKLGRWDEATQLAEQMTKRLARIGPMWIKYGDIILSSGSNDLLPAVKAFQTALTLSSQLMPAYIGLGKAYLRLGAQFQSFAKRCLGAALVLLAQSQHTTSGIYKQDNLQQDLEQLLQSVNSAPEIPAPFVHSSTTDKAIMQFETEWFAVPQEQMFERLQVARAYVRGGDEVEEEDRDPTTL